MLNKDLFTPEERANLLIKKFKEYDKKRQEYIDSLEHEIENLKYIIEDKEAEALEEVSQELIDENKRLKERVNELLVKCEGQKASIKGLNNKILFMSNQESVAIIEREPSKVEVRYINVRNELKKTRDSNKRMKRLISDLIYSLNHKYTDTMDSRILTFAEYLKNDNN